MRLYGRDPRERKTPEKGNTFVMTLGMAVPGYVHAARLSEGH